MLLQGLLCWSSTALWALLKRGYNFEGSISNLSWGVTTSLESWFWIAGAYQHQHKNHRRSYLWPLPTNSQNDGLTPSSDLSFYVFTSSKFAYCTPSLHLEQFFA